VEQADDAIAQEVDNLDNFILSQANFLSQANGGQPLKTVVAPARHHLSFNTVNLIDLHSLTALSGYHRYSLNGRVVYSRTQ
jgi:hypothetical protein